MTEENRASAFIKACLEAAKRYKAEGDQLVKECEQEGIEHNAAFWYEAEAEARRAVEIYRATLGAAQARTLYLLRAEGLKPFAEALESGEFSKHLGY